MYLFVLAGLYMFDRVRKQRRFAIVTTEPNDIAAEVHDRMPVILDDMGMLVWLSPATGLGGQKRLCQPYNGPLSRCPRPCINGRKLAVRTNSL